ncbi:MAG: phosphoribosyl-AMP cyclohydrolase [Hyphococcus sp.]
MTEKPFAARDDVQGSVEETDAFAPTFNSDGLIPAAVTDAGDGRLLMLAYMNHEALMKTIETGDAWYWSRSRAALWRKGETSGHTQKVVAIRTDCDQDAIELLVDQTGPACHTSRRSCFYRRLRKTGDCIALVFDD